ncbi:MAG: aspartate kinase [Flavobacteriales bacterium]
MKVFKFGGASVDDADGVKNLKEIVARFGGDELFIVVSAMGKTTNALEQVVQAYIAGRDWKSLLQSMFDSHLSVLNELVLEASDAHDSLEKIKQYAFTFLEQDTEADYDYLYDQIVSLGEILSTKIVASYLNQEGLATEWMDARKLVHTDNNYRNARVDWNQTKERVQKAWAEKKQSLVVSQGFIGGGDHNRMTTLGREGSDFSAAIFAHCLDAESVTIWKNVPGVLNADPQYFNNTVLLPNISYREAVELSYFGASVIHPKTLKPLENKNIPLYVKSFLEPAEPGTLINKNTSEDSKVASYIFKENQVLLSISSRDFSFIVEEHMSDIFNRFAKHKLKINTMQNSAISFSVSVDDDKAKLQSLIDDLKNDYAVLYNEGLELLTIRHFNEKIAEELAKGKEVLLQQKTRHTLRMLMRV